MARTDQAAGLPPVAGYQLERILGKGASGLVFKARAEGSGREVALKLFAPERLAEGEARARFAREAKLLAGSGHPCLVPVLDAVLDHDPPFLVFALMPGGDLANALERGLRLEGREIAALGARVAAALEHLHGLGVVHRDVKPGNILLDGEGRACLGDLGLAGGLPGQGFTVSGTVLGTAAYMAPEVLEGARATPASDLFSLGLVLAELFTGSRPVRRPEGVASLATLSPPRVPAGLAARLRQCLRTMPGDRPASAAVLRAALEAFP